MDLDKTAIARGENVVVVSFKGDRRRQPTRHIHQHQGHAPAGDGVEHLEAIQQSLARGRGEHPRPRGGRGTSRREHRMLRAQGDKPCRDGAIGGPLGQKFDHLGLRRNGKGRNVIHIWYCASGGRAGRRSDCHGHTWAHGCAPSPVGECGGKSGTPRPLSGPHGQAARAARVRQRRRTGVNHVS